MRHGLDRLVVHELEDQQFDELAHSRRNRSSGGVEGINGAVQCNEAVENRLEPACAQVVGDEVSGQVGNAQPGQRCLAQPKYVVALSLTLAATRRGLSRTG